MQASFKEGKVTTLPAVNTIADGTAVKTPGEKIFPYIQKNLDDIITVSDDELVVSFLDMVENHKMVVENSGLLTVAALKHLDVTDKRVVSILSGELLPLPFLPDGLAQILNVSPFGAMMNAPLRIYGGDIAGAEAASMLALQAFWLIAMVALGKFMQVKGMKKLAIVGG